MNSLKDSYQNEVRKELGYFATWEPSRQIELADYGIIKDNSFQVLGNLNTLGFNLYNNDSKQSKTSINYSSKGVSSSVINIDPSVTVPQSISSTFTLKIDFKIEQGIYLKIDKATNYSIKEIAALKDILEGLNKVNKWEFEFAFVSEVIHSDNATILISNEKDTSVEIELAAKLKEERTSISVDIELKTGLQVKKSKELGISIIGENNITALFKLSRLKKRTIWRDSKFDTRLFYPQPYIEGKSSFYSGDNFYEVYEIEQI